MTTSRKKVVAEVGAVFLSGNTLYPTLDMVVRIETWSQLTDKERRYARTIEYWKAEEQFASLEYVRFASAGRLDTGVIERSVFEGTRFETFEEMVEAYHQ